MISNQSTFVRMMTSAREYEQGAGPCDLRLPDRKRRSNRTNAAKRTASGSKPKEFCRIATRYDKLAMNFLSAISLTAAVAFWLGTSLDPRNARR